MTAQGLEVIDHAVQHTHEWVNELAGRLGWGSKRSTLHLMRAVLRRLRDHLQPEEMAQMSAQLPLLIRGMFFEGWVPAHTPIHARGANDFADAIKEEMGLDAEYEGSGDIRCVFEVLNARLSAGEVNDVRANRPEAVRALWPAP